MPYTQRVTLFKTLDSYSAPSDAQIALAKADGVKAWNGYLPGAHIDSTWKSTDFARIKDAGLYTLAYASGAADPLAMKTLALQWGVKGCLDVERSIRPNGTWVQPWLTDSGFGFYASQSGYPQDAAAFHVVAVYVVDDPHVSWPAGMPLPGNTPHGWQWCENEAAYGTDVDRSWFDSTVYVPNPAPTPTPTPTPIVDNEDMLYLFNTGAPGIWCLYFGKYFHVTPDDLAAFEAIATKGANGELIQTIGAAGHAVLVATYPA
jgi:hypothetical protein